MYDKTNVATFPILFSNNSVTILLNNSALIKSLESFFATIVSKDFLWGQLIRDWHFKINQKVRKYKDHMLFLTKVSL